MASLEKPEKCPDCGSVELRREKSPERWVCVCGKVVVSRRPKPITGVCRDCGRSREEASFNQHGNICKDCRKKYNKSYVAENRDKVNVQKRQGYAENRVERRAKANAYWQGSVEAFISDLFRRTKRCSWERFGKKNRVLPFEITKEFLLDLYKQQNGICPLSKLQMKHQWSSLYSVSVDRIDSALGYVPGNVQLITKAANLLKNDDTQAEALAFFEAVRQTSASSVPTISGTECTGGSHDKSGAGTAQGEDQTNVGQAALSEAAQTPS